MRRNTLLIRIFAILALIAFLVTSLITFMPSRVSAQSAQSKLEQAQSKQKELKEKINATEGKISDNNKKRQSIDAEISKVQAKIDELNAKISASNKKISEKQSELEVAERKSKEQRENYFHRAKMMVERGSVTYLEILLNSKSFSDLLSRFSVVKQIVRYDSNRLDELKAVEKKISDLKKELEGERQSLVNLKADESAQMSSLSAKRAESQRMIDSLMADKNSYKKALEAQERAEANARAEIARLSRNSGYSGKYSGTMIWPSSGPITSPYYMRVHPITGKLRQHTGIDIGSAYGTNIVAAASGVVIVAGYNAGGYGNYVVVDHGSGVSTLYAHASSLCVSVGQSVSQGELIAKVGSTGMSTGPHLHFEVLINGGHTNPMQYLP